MTSDWPKPRRARTGSMIGPTKSAIGRDHAFLRLHLRMGFSSSFCARRQKLPECRQERLTALIRRGAAVERGGASVDLVERDVLDVAGDPPPMAERILELPAAIAVELIGDRAQYLEA